MRKILLIAGHTGGLGRGVTDVLLQKNFDEVCLLTSHKPKQEADNLNRPIKIDLSDFESVGKLFNSFESGPDKLYFLFSSVGGFYGGKSVWETPVEEQLKMMNLNYTISFNLLHHFGRLVKKSAGGAAVITSAFSALHPEKDRAAYGASKAALNYLIQSIAIEGRAINLSVNAIAPYLIDTPANREWADEETVNKMQKPEDIGELVFQLFSGFHYISGNIIELTARFSGVKFL